MKQNHTKHVYFSFFNPLKVTGKLEIDSLGWVHGGELGGANSPCKTCINLWEGKKPKSDNLPGASKFCLWAGEIRSFVVVWTLGT